MAECASIQATEILTQNEIHEILRSTAERYLEAAPTQLKDIPRIGFHIKLVADAVGRRARVLDLGGGMGMFTPGSADVGMQATVVDDFSDPVNLRQGLTVLEAVHQKAGVTVVQRDIIDEGIDFPPNSFDAVTTFDSMEHWHHSPKSLFASVMQVLRPGGLFLLGVPNCKNIKKRIAYPLGLGNWSNMSDWYEQKRFRGHVREPDTSDLRYIGRDMNLTDVRIFGRNWMGYDIGGLTATITRFTDSPLRLFPSLCSDIYLWGKKPGG